MTFTTDLDNLIRHRHGDTKKLREIRDTVRHDNFITTDDKNYVQSLIDTYLKDQPLTTSPSRKQTSAKIKLQSKNTNNSDSQNNFTFSFSSNKKMGILAGAAAAIAIIVIVGFGAIDQNTTSSSISSTPNNPISISLDQTQYQRADIISISGDTISSTQPITLSIENTSGVKIWNEYIEPKGEGKFSTLVIAGGGGWQNSGTYTLTATQNDLEKEIKFKFIV